MEALRHGSEYALRHVCGQRCCSLPSVALVALTIWNYCAMIAYWRLRCIPRLIIMYEIPTLFFHTLVTCQLPQVHLVGIVLSLVTMLLIFLFGFVNVDNVEKRLTRCTVSLCDHTVQDFSSYHCREYNIIIGYDILNGSTVVLVDTVRKFCVD